VSSTVLNEIYHTSLADYVRFMLDGAVTQVFNARETDAAATGSQNVIYGGGVRAQVDW
jgi:hypothetical protein